MIEQAPPCSTEEHCITCGDVAVEMTVIEVRADGLALCRCEDGEQEAVEIGLFPDARAADRLLVHAGTAIQQLTEPVS